MTVLFLAAVGLTAAKVVDDLDAFTEQSSRWIDAAALLLIGLLMVLYAVTLAGPIPPFDLGPAFWL